LFNVVLITLSPLSQASCKWIVCSMSRDSCYGWYW